MEERAALERQIRLLSNLITNHKNTHGNMPAATAASCRPPGQSAWAAGNAPSSSVGSQRLPAQQASQGSNAWRSKYSLVNKSVGMESNDRPSTNLSQGQEMLTARPQLNSAGKCAAKVLAKQGQGEASSHRAGKARFLQTLNSELAVKKDKLLAMKEKLNEVKMARRRACGKGLSRHCSGKSSLSAQPPSMPEADRLAADLESQVSAELVNRTELSASVKYCTPTVRDPGEAQTVAVPSHAVKETCRGRAQRSHVTGRLSHTPGTGKRTNTSHSTGHMPTASSTGKESRYTWQKASDGGGLSNRRGSQETSEPSPPATPGPALPSTSRMPCAGTGPLTPKTSSALKSLKKQRTTTPVCSRASKGRKAKYVWVSNSARSGQANRKSVTAKAAKSPKCVVVGGNAVTHPSPECRSVGRHKKAGCPHKKGVTANKYRWKAVEMNEPASPTKSAYRWKSELSSTQMSGRRTSPAAVRKVESSADCVRKAVWGAATSHYRLKSKTKIIRRKAALSSPTERKLSLTNQVISKSRYLLVKRTYNSHGRWPLIVRTPGKGLVQISKHRLRRLPASAPHTNAKQGLSSLLSVKSPSTSRFINTRYKLVKRSTSLASPWTSPSPSQSLSFFRTRRNSCFSPRSQLLTRARLFSNSRLLQQQWKSKGIRCIGGVLYRVSANKLSKSPGLASKLALGGTRTPTPSGSSQADPDGADCYFPSSLARPLTPRYIASRAVQRSLAIIRQAKQRRSKKKEYCMYYNRFGKCNRGEKCPYIHDPEKVAVCTRFLRGTCKQTDGTCPFSHKVSKDKMPVCSYFLRGICSNSNCPYSHVYVSRKAAVCPDFLKGYCPLGEKCKKKHTLLCPEFSRTGRCAQGSTCKLQHRHRTAGRHRHSERESTSASTNQLRLTGQTHRELAEGEAVPSGIEAGSSASTNELGTSSTEQRLPAFIALHSPVSSQEISPLEGQSAAEALGKPMRIKPRL
ncbi:zinc finger CCCH domain-containing protein 3 [Callorhinchus milii]|uniref:Zinc finger CCCH domain-containing protein 3 n=1 Tax=Callorhinchus milii TaxID=7868 RepID=A0A4W3GKM2_CALMI|nr:zinc finger CCCH domain-containing protein 3 [Callorhinchus milii]|eukprot:gi/632966358/ref/XP_007899373.1/ PREDICTED: zinc finger CCCH domain-containing protein 3 [Callorhinchus milii]